MWKIVIDNSLCYLYKSYNDVKRFQRFYCFGNGWRAQGSFDIGQPFLARCEGRRQNQRKPFYNKVWYQGCYEETNHLLNYFYLLSHI